jgi:hypothetical protein
MIGMHDARNRVAKKSCVLLLLFFCFLSAAQAQKNEFAVSGSGLLTSASFSALAAAPVSKSNYARRLIPPCLGQPLSLAALRGGFNGSRSSGPSLNREDYNTFYFTPGLKVKFAAGFPVSPYLAGGLGWGSFRSTNTSATDNKFAADLGGGMDFSCGPNA